MCACVHLHKYLHVHTHFYFYLLLCMHCLYKISCKIHKDILKETSNNDCLPLAKGTKGMGEEAIFTIYLKNL